MLRCYKPRQAAHLETSLKQSQWICFLCLSFVKTIWLNFITYESGFEYQNFLNYVSLKMIILICNVHPTNEQCMWEWSIPDHTCAFMHSYVTHFHASHVQFQIIRIILHSTLTSVHCDQNFQILSTNHEVFFYLN